MKDSDWLTGKRSARGPPPPQQASALRRPDGKAASLAGANIGDGSDLSGSLEVIFDSIKSDAKTYSVPA